jgi:hypothetical protein
MVVAGVGLGEVTVFFAPGVGAIFHGENISSISRRGAHAMARARRYRDEAWPTFAQLFFPGPPEKQAAASCP